ncbi:MAG: AAA family ATPase [Eubacteriaceae bacterium]|nr:AAA family ATPase [Eubacteriaceae bacterium]
MSLPIIAATLPLCSRAASPSDIRECVFPVSGNLDLPPSIIDLAALEMEMSSKTNRERILDQATAPARRAMTPS